MSVVEDGRELVFVYGTLRSGAADAVRMVDSDWIESGCAKGVLYSIDSLPALVHVHDEGWNVVGEIHRVSPDLIRELDEFHGIPEQTLEGSRYKRIRRVIVSANSYSKRYEVWLWEWNGGMEDKVKIRSGNWMEMVIPRTTPIMTWVAFGCLPAGPLMLIASLYLGALWPLLADAIAVLSLGSPLAGCFALYLGGRRHERLRGLRLVLWLLLVIECLLVAGLAIDAFI